MLFKASAPGSLMLMGEYAVLKGHPALVCAIDKYIHVELTPRSDDSFVIESVLGRLCGRITEITIQDPFRFVLTTLKQFQNKIPSGFTLNIQSEFSDKVGFSSSAAVTVATLMVLANWIKWPVTQFELVKIGRELIRKVQGIGSGADVAACVYGGLVAFRSKPLTIEKFSKLHPITVIYSGSKTPTPIAIKQVADNFRSTPLLYKQICKLIGACTQAAIEAVKIENWILLGNLMKINQGIMVLLGVNTGELEAVIYTLNKQRSILGAKISGSGFGDCVVGLGSIPEDNLFDDFGKKQLIIPVNMTERGVWCDE